MRIIRTIFWLALLLIITFFLVSNDSIVTLSLWPLPLSLSLTLGAAMLMSLLLGVVLTLTWRVVIGIFK